jgi:hypothetical protein
MSEALEIGSSEPARRILEWCHIAMKLRPIEQIAGRSARRLPPNGREEVLEDIAAVRRRLWNGQTDRAIDPIGRLFHDLKADERASPAIVTLRGGLSNLRIYIEQNRGSIAGCGARYREGKRIAAAAAEARVNDLAARRMAEKRQMRWPERGANPLLQVRTALANGSRADRLAYQPPIQPGQTLISPFGPVPLFRRAA